jgi:hypothetical protein
MTDADKHDIVVTILEEPDQAACATMLAAEHPTATQADLLAIISEIDPELHKMGFPPLSVLRAELERVHPAWVTP